MNHDVRPVPSVSKAGYRPAKILVVDDDSDLCEFIQEVLSAEGMDTQVLTDSAEAAERLATERFDAVFLDMRMAPPDGVELARQIRSFGLNKTTPLIMITGETDRTVMSRAFQAGVNFFLFKPVDRARLMRLLNAADNFIHYEKRRSTRVKIEKRVLLQSMGYRINGTALDISSTGMLVEASRILPVGTTVEARLELKPGQLPLLLALRVVRIAGENQMGLAIERAGRLEKKALDEFLLCQAIRDVE